MKLSLKLYPVSVLCLSLLFTASFCCFRNVYMLHPIQTSLLASFKGTIATVVTFMAVCGPVKGWGDRISWDGIPRGRKPCPQQHNCQLSWKNWDITFCLMRAQQPLWASWICTAISPPKSNFLETCWGGAVPLKSIFSRGETWHEIVQNRNTQNDHHALVRKNVESNIPVSASNILEGMQKFEAILSHKLPLIHSQL